MPDHPRTLAIECATDACSVALFDEREVVAADHRVLGRGHAEHLVPMIAALPRKGRAERILVSLGPGSFTGVRIGIAVAGALGIAWHAKVQGYPTLALVAAMARDGAAEPVTVCMTGGHGEWFVQDFAANGLPETALASVPPAEAARRGHHPVVAGSQARSLTAMTGTVQRALDIFPDASFVASVPAELFADKITPIYGRGPDARLPT